jgi:Uncharacterized protein conserved in bacteria (DUF2188)
MARNQHVIPQGVRWAVRGAGNSRATRVLSSRREAIEVAREIARNQRTELVIHGADGRIREKTSFVGIKAAAERERAAT